MNFDYKKKSIIYKENIKIGKRIRDIIEMEDGRIVLLTDRGKKLDENPEILILSNKNNH
jgi:glucose/arabinose dehydrogenase